MTNAIDFDDLFRRALAFHQAGNLDEAEPAYRAILNADANRVDALTHLGTLCLQRGNREEAEKLLGLSLGINPDQPRALSNRGIALKGLKRFEEALGCYDRALALKPESAEAFYNRGNLLREMGRADDAIADYDRAIAIRPSYAMAFNSRAGALNDLARHAEAIASYDRAVALNPDFAIAYSDRGNVLSDLKRHDEAIANYDRAIALKPDFAEAFNNRGTALSAVGRHDEAIANFDRAIALKPDYAAAFNNRGVALNDLRRHVEAVASYDRAIALRPRDADAFVNRGNALRDLGRPDEALACYERAIALNPDSAAAFNSRGSLLGTLGRPDEALASYLRANTLSADHPFLPGNMLHTQMQMCDWTDLDSRFEQVILGVVRGAESCPPFALLAMPSTAEQQQRCAQIYAAGQCAVRPTFPGRKSEHGHQHIRLGYFSADFHNHATAYLIAELIERHDRLQFEVIGVSFGPARDDVMRRRLSRAFDRFLDVSNLPDRQIADLAREHQLDIAIDLKGFTADSRPGIFGWQPAPVQVSYLGYPGTMGCAAIDYIVADPVLIPEGDRQFYSEKIVYLPDSYQVNDRKREIAARVYTRRELGLPESGFVFCCFNNNFKITPDLFAVWMRLLRRVPGSVLWLLEDNAFARSNLQRTAEQHGISPERLIFAPRVGLAEHLARHRVADLFLDTFHCNAHTTASDALWTGLPVLTCLGNTFAGRVGASLLTAIGLPELITNSHAEYEALAVTLATRPDKLDAIKNKLSEQRLTCPLFDTSRFTTNLEDAYVQMWRRHQEGLAPEHIHVRAPAR